MTRKHRPTEERWLGGYIRKGRRGPIYVIERRVMGQHFHISTRCHTLRAALSHLERFEADPSTYDPRGDARGRVEVSAELVNGYHDYQRARGISPDWCVEVSRLLTHWMEDLNGRDLRRVSLADVKAILAKRPTSLRSRGVAFKGFCRWLRTEKGLLQHAEDVSLNLALPPIRPAKLERKRAVPTEHLEAVRPHLPQLTRDCLDFLSHTGWHVSELRRFAGGEGFMRLRLERIEPADVLAVAVVKHKSGRVHATQLRSEAAKAAAERILRRGAIPSSTVLAQHVRRACHKLAGLGSEVPAFGLGRMRHTVATHAYEQGAPIESVMRFLGHRTPLTTSDYYVDTPRSPDAVPALRLVDAS